jgi:hypothetical protein
MSTTRVIAAASIGLALAGCTTTPSSEPITSLTTTIAAPATSVTTTIAVPSLQPGPHSELLDVDLPAGTVLVDRRDRGPHLGHVEGWRYSAPYDDTVAFLRKQFATGPKFDSQGATSWRNLPPCYGPRHQSPPGGWVLDDRTEWVWADFTSMALAVEVYTPSSTTAPNEIEMYYMPWGNDYICNRS